MREMGKLVEGLKPCPFCGGKRASLVVRAQDGGGDDQYTIVCWSCAAEGGWAKSEGGARRHWDMRPEEKKNA